MPRAKAATRGDKIAKLIEGTEAAIAAMYPQGKIKADTDAGKAQGFLEAALDHMKRAAKHQAAHNAGLLKQVEALRAELAQ